MAAQKLNHTSVAVRVLGVLSAEFLVLRLAIDGTRAMFSAAHQDRLMAQGQGHLISALIFAITFWCLLAFALGYFLMN